MNLFDPANDFNLNALAFGVLILLLCLLFQIAIIHVTASGITALQRRRMYLTGLGGDQLTFVIGAVVLLSIHLVHIYIWGYALFLPGIVTPLSAAVIFAGSTYTTVGFADDPLKGDWQLLTVIMATSGLFSFGMSTSIMFMLSQKIFSGFNLLRIQSHRKGVTPDV